MPSLRDADEVLQVREEGREGLLMAERTKTQPNWRYGWEPVESFPPYYVAVSFLGVSRPYITEREEGIYQLYWPGPVDGKFGSRLRLLSLLSGIRDEDVPLVSEMVHPYSTLAGAESNERAAFEARSKAIAQHDRAVRELEEARAALK